MKMIACFIAGCLLLQKPLMSQGKYAGSLKKLIGKTYTDSKKLSGLTGWKFREGSLLTEINNPERMAVDLLQKGTTYAVIFGYMEDTASNQYVVADVIEIRNVLKGWQVKTTLCRQYQQENIEIVALVKTANKAYWTQVKQAWRLNRDKRRVEGLSVQGIDCIYEGFGE